MLGTRAQELDAGFGRVAVADIIAGVQHRPVGQAQLLSALQTASSAARLP